MAGLLASWWLAGRGHAGRGTLIEETQGLQWTVCSGCGWDLQLGASVDLSASLRQPHTHS